MEWMVMENERQEREAEKRLESLPVCSICDEPIQGEWTWIIDGKYICEDCMDDFRVETEGLVD